MPIGPAALPLVQDALRTNDTRLISGALGPYGAAHLDDHGYRCVYYGHFGQGCVHTRMDFDLKTAAGVKTFRSFMEK